MKNKELLKRVGYFVLICLSFYIATRSYFEDKKTKLYAGLLLVQEMYMILSVESKIQRKKNMKEIQIIMQIN